MLCRGWYGVFQKMGGTPGVGLMHSGFQPELLISGGIMGELTTNTKNMFKQLKTLGMSLGMYSQIYP